MPAFLTNRCLSISPLLIPSLGAKYFTFFFNLPKWICIASFNFSHSTINRSTKWLMSGRQRPSGCSSKQTQIRIKAAFISKGWKFLSIRIICWWLSLSTQLRPFFFFFSTLHVIEESSNNWPSSVEVLTVAWPHFIHSLTCWLRSCDSYPRLPDYRFIWELCGASDLLYTDHRIIG